MKQIIVVAGFLLSGQFLMGQPYFAVHTTDSIAYYGSFQDALSNAVDDDTIYVPGGTFQVGTVNIDKRLTIYGVGYFPDSCVATNISDLIGNIRILTGADGGLLSGLKISGYVTFGTNADNQVVHGYKISRCWITSYLYLSYNGSSATNSSDLIITECVVSVDFYGGYADAVFVQKSILQRYVHYFDNTVFRNCHFLHHGNSNSGYEQAQTLFHVTNSFFENSVFSFYYNYSFGNDSYVTNNGFYNNLFRVSVSFPVNSNVGENNIFDTNPNTVWTSVASINSYSTSDDYRIIPGSAAEDAGSDGYHIGIYGSAQPFKHVPPNPHVSYKNIDRQLSGDGELNVEVRVSAQDR